MVDDEPADIDAAQLLVELQRVGRRLAVEADHRAREREPGAELLRLHLRAAGEGLA